MHAIHFSFYYYRVLYSSSKVEKQILLEKYYTSKLVLIYRFIWCHLLNVLIFINTKYEWKVAGLKSIYIFFEVRYWLTLVFFYFFPNWAILFECINLIDMHVTNFDQHYLTSRLSFIKSSKSCKCRLCQERNKWESSMTQLITKIHDICFVRMRYHIIECDLNNAWKCILIRLLPYYIYMIVRLLFFSVRDGTYL